MACTCAEDHAESGITESLTWWCGMFGCLTCVREHRVCEETR